MLLFWHPKDPSCRDKTSLCAQLGGRHAYLAFLLVGSVLDLQSH
jgi:hypothetical protein